MATVNIDVDWWRHPKVTRLSLAASGLWISARCWSAAQSCDVVPPGFLRLVGGSITEADELVAVGLWTDTGDGWFIEADPVGPRVRRAYIPAALRRQVYCRDGWSCRHCGADRDLTLDHVTAWSKGGPDTFENFQTLCRPCNSRKGCS